jgi:hypothetical protein
MIEEIILALSLSGRYNRVHVLLARLHCRFVLACACFMVYRSYFTLTVFHRLTC